MAYIKPCRRCPLRTRPKGCQGYKDALRIARTAKLQVTALTIKCHNLKTLFYPGVRVVVSGAVALTWQEYGHEIPEYVEDEKFEATVMRWSGPKLVLCTDEPWHCNGYYHRKAWPNMLELLDEPRKEVCEKCGHPLDMLEFQNHWCGKCNPQKGPL